MLGSKSKIANNWHKIGQCHFLARTVNWHKSEIFNPILTLLFKCSFFKNNIMVTITKLYFLEVRFWFLPQFLLSGLTKAALHVWTLNYLKMSGRALAFPYNS